MFAIGTGILAMLCKGGLFIVERVHKNNGQSDRININESLFQKIIELLENPDESDEILVRVIVSGIIEAYNLGYADGHNTI